MIANQVKDWKATIENPDAVVTDLRTLKQNGCLQKACRMFANKLNEGGLDMRVLLKPEYFGEIEIPWSEDLVREHLFNFIARAMFDGRTSSQLDTKEISEAWEVFMRHMGSKHGVTVPWPDRWNGGGDDQ